MGCKYVVYTDMFLMIDNYDSFVHNLARYFVIAGVDVDIARNDAIEIAQIEQMAPQGIIISPGPCTPNEAGIGVEIVRRFRAQVPILGVCLGHQIIGEAYGGKTRRAVLPVHGKASIIAHDSSDLFAGIPSPFQVGRYHSLIVDLPESGDIIVNARNDDGEIMAMQHATHPVYGVQFHPESILTEHGLKIVQNFVDLARCMNTLAR